MGQMPAPPARAPGRPPPGAARTDLRRQAAHAAAGLGSGDSLFGPLSACLFSFYLYRAGWQAMHALPGHACECVNLSM